MFCDLIIIWTLFVLLKGLFLITFEVEGNPKTMMAKYWLLFTKNPKKKLPILSSIIGNIIPIF